MLPFIITVICSLVLLAVSRAAAEKSNAGLIAQTAAIMLCVVFVASLVVRFIFTIVLLQCVLTLLFVAFVANLRPAPRALFACVLAAVAVAYAVGGYGVWQKNQQIQALADDYPIVSIRERLDFDTPRVATHTQEPLPLASHVAARLEHLDKIHNRTSSRESRLRQLHDGTRYDFVLASGFGVGRMLGFTRSSVELPEIEPVPLPAPPAEEAYVEHTTAAPADQPWGESQQAHLMTLHQYGYDDFFQRERMGFVPAPGLAVGFEPHAFKWMPPIGRLDQWQISQLDLISLLLHDPPVAYVSQNLPRMDELVDAPTRPLTPFEETALEQLRTQQDLVIDDFDVNTIRMVGSLRASENCLRCHAVQHGELLGAFSYEITRLHPLPPVERPHAVRPVETTIPALSLRPAPSPAER